MFEPRSYKLSNQSSLDSLSDIRDKRFCVLSKNMERQVLDENGQLISLISHNDGNMFNEGFLCFNKNYMDINGNVLFENGIITTKTLQ